MPDRHLDENGFVVDLDRPPEPGHLTAEDRRLAAIAACELCDPTGYRHGTIRCDHRNYAAVAERHRDEIRAELDKIRHRKETPPPHPRTEPQRAMKDHYALSPDAEATIATDDYRDAVQDAQDTGHHGLATGDFTGYAEAFQRLQATAVAAISARQRAEQAAPRLRIVR